MSRRVELDDREDPAKADLDAQGLMPPPAAAAPIKACLFTSQAPCSQSACNRGDRGDVYTGHTGVTELLGLTHCAIWTM